MKRSSFGNCRRWKVSMRSRANFSASSVAAIAGLHRGLDLGRRDAQAGGVELEPVEFSRRLDQRGVAARGHVVDDGARGRLDIGGHLALGGEEMRKSLGRNRRCERSSRTGMEASVLRGFVSYCNGAAPSPRQPLELPDRARRHRRRRRTSTPLLQIRRRRVPPGRDRSARIPGIRRRAGAPRLRKQQQGAAAGRVGSR